MPSSADDIVGTVTKNLLEIQQKNFSALTKILSRIGYLARQRLPLCSHNDSESNFRQLLLLRAEDDPNFQEWSVAIIGKSVVVMIFHKTCKEQ